MALPLPEGDAVPIEATNQAVVRLATEGAILIGSKRIAQRLVDQLEDTFWKTVFEATLAEKEREGRDAALGGLNRALGLARDDRERLIVLLREASLGVWPLPLDPDTLEGIDPVDIDLLKARSELARGLRPEAIARLRRWSDSSIQITDQLAEAYVASGDPYAAIDSLRSGAKRFQSPEFLVTALDIARKARLTKETLVVGREALERLPPSAKAASYVRHRLIESAGLFARTQLRHEPDSTPTRWALIVALHNRTRLDDAWRALTEIQLEPLDEYQARIKIRLLSRYDPSPKTVDQILELADRFRESEILVGSALTSIFTMRPEFELPAPVLARLHSQTAEFFERFPESEILRRVQFEAPEQVLEALAQQLTAGRQQLESIAAEVQRGRVPYGAAASATGNLYTTILINRGIGPLVGVPVAPSLLAADIDAAKQSLDQTVVLDLSTLSVAVGSPTLWSVVRSSFHRIVLSDLAVFDAVAARDAASLRSPLALTVDESGQPHAVEISTDEAERLAADTAWIADRALELDQSAVRELSLFPQWDLERAGAWASAVELASERALPLLSDDLVLRQLARAKGVAAFGTYALARVLREAGRIDDATAKAFDGLFFERAVVDLPTAREWIETSAATNNWRSSPSLLAAARPAMWTDASAAIGFFASIFQRVHREAPEQLSSWAFAAMLGGSFLPGVAARSFIADLLLAAILAAGSASSQVGSLVVAAREAARRLGAGDPLEPTAAKLLNLAAAELTPASAAQFTISVFAALDEADRIAVMRVVADPTQRPTQS